MLHDVMNGHHIENWMLPLSPTVALTRAAYEQRLTMYLFKVDASVFSERCLFVPWAFAPIGSHRLMEVSAGLVIILYGAGRFLKPGLQRYVTSASFSSVLL